MNYIKFCQKKTFHLLLFTMILSLFSTSIYAQGEVPLRRPISPSSPMWLIHIDTWNYADPQKIIDLIPDDIKPYVVMNISLSISHDEGTTSFQVAEYGYEIAKSWVRACAQNQMWAIVQHSSGGYAQFSDFDLSVYEEFYREYPNFIGFSYAEQFWGYNEPNEPLSADWSDRMSHFANLLELNNKYGGYLVVSMCWNQWGPSINPIGQMKRSPDFAEACRKYTKNYILCEKYTQQAYQSDMESICLGAYLSGYSGNYGIRYDDTGWTNPSGEHEDFTMATGGAVHLEHIMLTGQTVVDGPELIWTMCFRETGRIPTTDGYTMRNWTTFPQFDNVSIDNFRKILDGTVRIPSREEVIDRTKVFIINDVNAGSADDIYSTPTTLFEGLYRMDGDGNLRDNKTFFKKTGRYPTIPIFFDLDDTLANSFELQIKKSEYSTKWPTISAKVNEMNTLFPDEYSGDIYAGRLENRWVVYNPYKVVKTAKGTIPFKYNTSDSIELSFSQYTAGVLKEHADSIHIYLSNFDNEVDLGLKTDIIKIYGSTSEPSYNWTDRGDHQASEVTKSWAGGVFTLTIEHNGPLDLNIACSGDAIDRLTDYTEAVIIEPEKPTIYTGPRQYEAECFDYKNITNVITQGKGGGIRFYQGQGYLHFGGGSAASARDTVYALRTGSYILETRYSASSSDVNNIDLYVNGVKVTTPSFKKTESDSDWKINEQIIQLNKGKNTIVFSANGPGSNKMYIDNIVISQGSITNIYNFNNDDTSSVATTPPAQLITTESGSAGVVSYEDGNGITGNSLKTYSVGAKNNTGVANLDMFHKTGRNYSVSWKEYYNTTGGEKGILMRGTDVTGNNSYAEGLLSGYLFTVTNNADSTITLKSYISDTSGLSSKTSFTSSFKVSAGMAAWYRAIALDNDLWIECSADGKNWEGASSTQFTDSSWYKGSSQIVWGFGTSNFEWVMDDITFMSGNISVSRLYHDGLDYIQGSGPSAYKAVTILGSSLIDDLTIKASDGFEISTGPKSTYDTILTLSPTNENMVEEQEIYVRLCKDLPINSYEGTLSFISYGTASNELRLSGQVKPQPSTIKYNFSNDAATTSASTPPALNTMIGTGNAATAGVVSYTDANNVTSNMITPYSGGQRNSTGAIDLNLFPNNGTDYSVTWKQCVGSASSGYKVGVLLRGDTLKYGDASSGYVEGMRHGYLFIAYTTGSSSEFRIYRSDDSFNSLNVMVNTGAGLDPAAGQPIWYRASVSGSSNVSLKLEYSTDSLNWSTGASTNDNAGTFQAGATQLVWGLGVGDVNFYMDDITYYGLSESSGTLPKVFASNVDTIKNYTYMQGFGPTPAQSFKVWGGPLTSDVDILAPHGYEISLDTTKGFVSSITIPVSTDTLTETTLYARMAGGLFANTYQGNVIVMSNGVLNQLINLIGTVEAGPEIIVSQEELSYEYVEGSGPSGMFSFRVEGAYLQEDVMIDVSGDFEISLSSGSGYTNSLNLTPVNETISSTRVYTRMKSGLSVGDYEGAITLSSTGAIDQIISLSGTVESSTDIRNIVHDDATVLFTEYFTLTGVKIIRDEELKGIFIERKHMSDGSTITSKILFKGK